MAKLSAKKTPTCYKVFPLVKKLQSEWEDLFKNRQYSSVYKALEAGLKNTVEWYRKADDTLIYFISYSEDPALFSKLELPLSLIVLYLT